MNLMNKLVLCLTVFFVLTFNYSFSQSKDYTKGKYTQGKTFKSVRLIGYGTDYSGGFDAPEMVLSKTDNSKIKLGLFEVFTFIEGENLEVTFFFPEDKKNNKWKLTKYNFMGKSKKFPGMYSVLVIESISNISTGEILDGTIKIAEKFMNSKELVIKISDDVSKKTKTDNVCSFKIKKHRKKFKKVMSSKYFSKDEELMN